MATILFLFGVGFSVVSAYLLFTGLQIEVVVPVAPAVAEQLPQGMDGIANLQLMDQQDVLITLGAAAAIVSAILLAGAAVVARLSAGEESQS